MMTWPNEAGPFDRIVKALGENSCSLCTVQFRLAHRTEIARVGGEAHLYACTRVATAHDECDHGQVGVSGLTCTQLIS